jgi:hypothetical protein
MVKLILIILLSTLNLFSEFQIEYWAYGNRRMQTETLRGKQTYQDTRKTDQSFLVNGNFQGSKDNFKYDFGFSFAKRLKDSEQKDYLYISENAYIGFEAKKVDLLLGRKVFTNSNFFKDSKRDGVEGISAEYKPNEFFKINFYLVDFYRAFPIIERLYFLDVKAIATGERIRHGLALEYNSSQIESKIQVLYLNLGNTGKYSKDEELTKPNGDKDFLYNVNWNVFWKNPYFVTGINLAISRGIDKTISNPERKERSIPISGELLELFFSTYIKFLQIKASSFLPDSDKKNKAGEILELGYIGMGAYPSTSFLMNQDLNFYPSGWVTGNGFEKTFSYQNGRWNSFWARLSFSIKFDKLSISLTGDHFTPRLNSGSSNGSLSIDRREFTKLFLAEATLDILYGNKETGYYLRGLISTLHSSKEISIESNSFFIAGGIWL